MPTKDIYECNPVTKVKGEMSKEAVVNTAPKDNIVNTPTVKDVREIHNTEGLNQFIVYNQDGNKIEIGTNVEIDGELTVGGGEYGGEYGVKLSGSNPTLTRLKNAVGKTYQFNSNNEVISDFDDIYPWGNIEYYTDDSGNKFVRIPKFYSKKEWTTDGWRLYICRTKLTGYDTLFKYTDSNGTEKEVDYVDIGCYEASKDANDKLQSVSGVAPLVSQTMATFRTQAKANGSGYGIEDYTIREIVNQLFVVEFATINSQSVFNGNVSSSAALDTGTTDTLALSSGKLSSGAFKYRGIENWYGNVYEFVDGISFSGNNVYYSNKPSDYESAKTTGSYELVGTCASENGYGKVMTKFSNNDLLGYITQVGGSTASYYCDYYYTGGTILYVGGAWSNGSRAGLFFLAGDYGASVASSYVGCRLVHIPL